MAILLHAQYLWNKAFFFLPNKVRLCIKLHPQTIHVFNLNNVDFCWRTNQSGVRLRKDQKGYLKTSSSIGEVPSGVGGGGWGWFDNTTEFERPIGRKAEKANWKRKDGDKDFGEYLAKKLHYIEEAHEQKKEALWFWKGKGLSRWRKN